MRCVVFAYQEIGYVALEELLRLGAEVRLVVTHADDPQENIWFRSVRGLAEKHGLEVAAPPNVNSPEWVEKIRALKPEFFFSFYYRKLLRAPLLAVPSRGALNLHGSLLPRYRGRCPVNWALIYGERETGLTLHYMIEQPDAGDIVAQCVVPIDDEDTAFTVYQKLARAAPRLLRDVYPLLCAGTAPRIPQDPAKATYFGGRRPEDGRIHWQMSARQVFNLVRAVTWPYPGAFTLWRGRELKVWKARPIAWLSPTAKPGTIVQREPVLVVSCGEGALILESVQWGVEPAQPGSRWAREHKVREGDCFL